MGTVESDRTGKEEKEIEEEEEEAEEARVIDRLLLYLTCLCYGQTFSKKNKNKTRKRTRKEEEN